MTKLLTTGEMIDTLKVGEVAEGVHGYYQETKLRMTDYHEIVYVIGKSSSANNFFELNAFSHNAKWCILPNYVSFDEAMEALKEGVSVALHRDSIPEKTMFRHWYKLETRNDLIFSDLFNGNWTIEGDTND